MVTVLSGYSLAIVREVTSPETGLQRTCKFPPRTAEIVEACDALKERAARFSRFQNWGKNQLEAPSPPKPTAEQMATMYPDGVVPSALKAENPALIAGSGFKLGQAPSWDRIIKNYSAHPERLTHLTAALGRRKSLRA